MARDRPALILHAGHPRTGTSAIQCALARAIPQLAAHGLHYPAPPDLAAVQAGAASGGNIHAPRLAERYHAARPRVPAGGRVLMSSEAAFRVLPEDPAPLRALLSDGVPVEIVLYLRNPGALARSVHAQMVALRGLQVDLDAFLDRFRFLDQVERFLDLAAGLGLPLWVWNYSTDPEAAIPVMAEILGLPPGTLAPPPLPRVNRSMTRAELRALQEIARTQGAEAAATVARALAAELPGQPPDPLQATAAAWGAFARRLAPQVARINARLPADAGLQVEPYEVVFGTHAAAPMPLDDRQRAVMAAALSGWRPGAADPLSDRLVRGLNARAPGVARGLRFVRDRLRG